LRIRKKYLRILINALKFKVAVEGADFLRTVFLIHLVIRMRGIKMSALERVKIRPFMKRCALGNHSDLGNFGFCK
jgi:hypothetical protein